MSPADVELATFVIAGIMVVLIAVMAASYINSYNQAAAPTTAVVYVREPSDVAPVPAAQAGISTDSMYVNTTS